MADSPSGVFWTHHDRGASETSRTLVLSTLIVVSAVGMSLSLAAIATASSHAFSVEIGLANDIPGPIEYRDARGRHTVIVAFDRPLTDPGNVTFRVEGRNLRGEVVSYSRKATGPDVTLRDGVRANGSALENSVAVVRLGSDMGDDLVANATLTLDYDNAGAGSFERNFTIITTSTSLDAGAPADTAVYEGEQVAIYNLTADHDAYEVFAHGAFQFSGEPGKNTTVTVEFTESDDFQAGTNYRFEFLDDDASPRTVTGTARVDLRNLGLDIALERGGESQPYPAFSPPNETITATVKSDVAGRFVRVEILASNATGPIQSEVIDLRGGGADRETNVSFRVNPAGNEVTYRARAVDVETTATATSEGFTLIPWKGDLKFTADQYVGVRGDEVRFTVDLGNLREARVEIRGDEGDYQAGFNVVDDNGDGRVTVVLDTYQEGVATPTADPVTVDRYRHVTAEGGHIENYRKIYRNPGRPLGAGTYDLRVGAFEDAAPLDTATIRLDPRETGEVRTWVAPASAVADGRTLAEATLGSEVAVGDAVIIQVNATGLYGFLDSGYDLSVDPDNPDYATHGVGMLITRIDGAPGDGAILPIDPADMIVNPEAGEIYIVLDTRELAVAPGETYRATFLINGTLSPFEAPPGGEVATANTTFKIRTRTVTWGSTTNATGVVHAEAGTMTISGRTTAAPGTTFRIEVQSRRNGLPFTFTRENVTVGPDGRFEARFNFGRENIEDALESGAVPFSLTVTDRSLTGAIAVNDTLPGVIHPPPTAMLLFEDQRIGDDSVVIVRSASLNRGGFVAVHTGNPDGPIVGVSDYLTPDPHESVRITLKESIERNRTLIAVAHRDTDDNETFGYPDADGPYTINGTVVADQAIITVHTPTPPPTSVSPTTVSPTSTEATPTTTTTTIVTPTPTLTITVTPTPTLTSTTVLGTTTADDDSGRLPGVPGFGLGVAVIALLVAAFLARRHQ